MVDHLNSQNGDVMDQTPVTSAPVDEMPDIPLFGDTPAEAASTEATPGETANTTDGAAATEQGNEAKSTTEANVSEATETTTETPPASEQSTQENQTTEQAPVLSREEQRQAAQMAWQQRQRTRNEVAQQIDQAYAPQAAEQLVEEGYSPEAAQIEALRQEMYYERERGRVAELNAGMRAEAVEIFSDFPLFDPKSADYNESVANLVQQNYLRDARVQLDDRGIILNADVPIYDYYKQQHEIFNAGASRGATKGQAQVQDMLARTENPGGSNAGSQAAPNSIEEFEARYGDMPIA